MFNATKYYLGDYARKRMEHGMERWGAAKSAIIISALITSGCATVNQELLEANLPEPPAVWAATDEAVDAPTGDWIGAFGDETLRSLVSEAMQHNNNLLAAAANLDAARSGSRIARANLLPTVNASGNGSRNAIVVDPTIAAQTGGGGSSAVDRQGLIDQFGVDSNGDGTIDGLDTTGNGVADTEIPNNRAYVNNFSIGAQISWELDLWGRITDETRAAYKDARASSSDLRGTELSIAGAVSQSWFNLVEARQQRELADRDVTARESNLRITERRYERGVASSLDLRLSRSALGTSQANNAVRLRLEKEASRRLEVLLGRYPAAELAAAETLPDLPALAGAGAPGDLLARRPDLIAAEQRMEAAGLRSRAARKAFLPQLTLSSQINASGPDISDIFDPKRLAGNFAAGLFQPLFQGGRIKANASRQRALAEVSLFNYTQTALEAYEEAENALSAEGLLALQEEALKFAYEEAAAAEELTERRYSSGAATIFNLLDAQTRRISAESQYIQAQRNRVTNRVLLYLAIGGDFLTEQRLAAMVPDPGE